MAERYVQKLRWPDAGSIVLAVAVLLVCVGYLRILATLPSYGGLKLNAHSWHVITAPPCPSREEVSAGAVDTCLRVGDRVVSLGDLDLDTYRSDWSAYLYRGRNSDSTLDVRVLRGDQVREIRLRPGDSLPVPFFYWAMPLIFWIVGSGVALLVRPRNASWLTLLALCYTTAIWIAAGLLSYFRVGGATYVFHGLIWFFLPLLIHVHLAVPYPILPSFRKWLVPALYVASVTIAGFDIVVGVPQGAVLLWVGCAILATIALLLLRLVHSSNRTQRMADRIMLLGVALGMLPLAILSMMPAISAQSEVYGLLDGLATALLVVFFPIWPLSYLYSLHKYSSGSVVLRANRLLGAYGFFCLSITGFLTLYAVGERWTTGPDGRVALALGLSVAFLVVAPDLRRRFQKFVDRTVYGIEYLPDEIIGVFAARIPTAFDLPNLRKILLDEVLPTLMIRQSALFIWNDEGQIEEVYRDGDVSFEGLLDDFELEEWTASPREPFETPDAPAWVRFAVPLQGRDRTLGIWLLGRRDPDDLYPAADRELLNSIANQIAPVVENIRLVERAQREVEENRRLQQQLIQSQKMEAIGRLSAGVAHDFNNLLSVILGYSSLLLVKYKGDEALTGYLDDIRDAGDRAAALTRQLLAFSRQQVMEARAVQLNHVVIDVERMLQRLAGEDVEVRTELGEDLPKVRIDPSQMGQVVMNLAVNARDAMPDGGVFELRTTPVRLEEGLVDPIQGEIPPGDYALLSVSDSGVGMAEDQLQRIFEPYFTTKELGKGTGLGLSMVYGIVSQFQGHIRVESELGQGTRFSIYLPAYGGDESAVGIRSPLQNNESLRGTESILVVEDEDSVRHVACEILQAQGYRVTEACDGTEALDVYDDMDEPPDLLLTDVVMPQMKGTDLAVLLTRKQPGLRVLFMSGYNEESVFSDWKTELDRPALLAKPFSPSSLLAEIRKLLEAGAGSVSTGVAEERSV